MNGFFEKMKTVLIAKLFSAVRDWFKSSDELLDTPEEQLAFGKLVAEAIELKGLLEEQEAAIGTRLAVRLNDDALEPLAIYFRANPDAELSSIPRPLLIKFAKSMGVFSLVLSLEMFDTFIDTEAERDNLAAKIHDSLPEDIPVIPRVVEVALYEAVIQEIREKFFLKMIDKLKIDAPAPKEAV